MSDIIERFIRENKTAFDNQNPTPGIWENIDKRMNRDEKGKSARVPRMSIRHVFRYAAAIVLLVGMGFAFGYFLQTSESANLANAEVNSEYEEMEKYFANQINKKMTVLASYDHPEAEETDIQQIDETIAELKLELEGVLPGNEEQVINAIIQNYQTKIAILETILGKLPSNHQTSNKNETIEI